MHKPLIQENQKNEDTFKNALIFALTCQIPIFILSSLTSIPPIAYQVFSFALIAFWVCVIVMIIKRRNKPTKFDLILIRAGFIPLLIFTGILCDKIWTFRGF